MKSSKAIDFLVDHQNSDGLWRDFRTLAGEGADWPTGFIGTALVRSGAGRAPLERAAAALAATQHDDGGWGFHTGVPTDADSTAWALLLTTEVNQTRVEEAAECLARYQDRDSGGLPTYLEAGPIRRYMGLSRSVGLDGWRSPHLEVTATAGRAFAAAGGEYLDRAAAAWRFVRSRQRADGSWRSYWWVGPHFPTLQAVELACVMGDADATARAAAWALAEQREDGGWGTPTSAFSTSLSLSILTRAGMRGPRVARAIARLHALQKADGGWPGHAELRIPPPGVVEPDDHESWRVDKLGTGVVIHDQHRLFTSAACVVALAGSSVA